MPFILNNPVHLRKSLPPLKWPSQQRLLSVRISKKTLDASSGKKLEIVSLQIHLLPGCMEIANLLAKNVKLYRFLLLK